MVVIAHGSPELELFESLLPKNIGTADNGEDNNS